MNIGTYLKGAREARRVTLDALARSTKIQRVLLADLEANNLSRWPKHQIYRHGYLRSYAEAVGLDPRDVIARFDEEHPDDHPVAFAPRRKRASSAWTHAGHAAILAVAIGVLLDVGFGLLQVRETGAAASAPPQEDAADTGIDISPTSPATTVALAASSSLPPVENIPAPALEPEAPADIEGELRINSDPPDAFVTVNDIGRGKTPLRVRYLPMGLYTVRVIHPGFKAGEKRVTLTVERPNRNVTVVLTDEDR
jgi:cytoskeletal protein RodZ